MTIQALLPVANGSEDIETVTIIDVLVRAGLSVTTASCDDKDSLHVKLARGVNIIADCFIHEVQQQAFDP